MTTSTTEIARLSNITASERAVELNAKTRAWVEAAEGRGAGFLVEDQEFWANQGTVTGLDLECSLLAGEISDSYKERYGIRPRFYVFSEMTLPELETELESILPTEKELEDERWDEADSQWEEMQAKAEVEAEQALIDADEDILWALQDQLEGARS